MVPCLPEMFYLEMVGGTLGVAAELFPLPFQKKAEEANRASEKTGKKTTVPKKKTDKPGHKVTFTKVNTLISFPTVAPQL